MHRRQGSKGEDSRRLPDAQALFDVIHEDGSRLDTSEQREVGHHEIDHQSLSLPSPSLPTQQQYQQRHTIETDGWDNSVSGGIQSPLRSRLHNYTSHHLQRASPQSLPDQLSPHEFLTPHTQSQPLYGRRDEFPTSTSTISGQGNFDNRTQFLISQNLSLLESDIRPATFGQQPGWEMRLANSPSSAQNRHITETELPAIPSAQHHNILPSFLNLETTTTRRESQGSGRSPRNRSLNLSSPTNRGEAQDPAALSQQSSYNIFQATSPTSEESKFSPLPQNLRGDPFRSAKIKTELCRYHNTKKGCVFGDKCNYAHGEHELKFNKLLALEHAGLVDVEIFRTQPCFTWVTTGACPFDQRCTSLHDPRVNGVQPSWLPHAEVMVNNMGRDTHVDKLYHQQLCAVYSSSPIYGFAPKKKWKADATRTHEAWKEFYAYVCNMDGDRPYTTSWPLHLQKGDREPLPSQGDSAHTVNEISEMHRLFIALKMRERRVAKCYTYLPSHVFCGELCMVLQKRCFRLEKQGGYEGNQHSLVEIPTQDSTMLAPNADDVIIAREIAFGPVADASVRRVSIWFNVSSDDIVSCTRQQARRHKRSRHRLRSKRDREVHPNPEFSTVSTSHEQNRIQDCYSIPPFHSYQSFDDAAFDLVTGTLTHRFRVLGYLSQSHVGLLRDLAAEEESLRESFESQRRFWVTWVWPKKIGSNHVYDETDVPPVDGAYNFVAYGDPGYGEDSLFFGRDDEAGPPVVSKQAKLATGFIWRSFVMNLQLSSDRGAVEVPLSEEEMPSHDRLIPFIRRLPVLRRLSLGATVRHSSRNLPTLREFCHFTGAPVYSLDTLIREWGVLRQQYDDSSSNPLREAQIGKNALADPTNPTQRRSLTYSADEAAKILTRVIPGCSHTFQML